MAGFDEAGARSALAVMQDRLARDPVAALGLPANATADDLRAAFLELTKQFHPVRFGRMASDIQKMSNEVFLALRAAHDALAKTLRRRSGPIPAVRAPGQAPSSPIPVVSAPAARPPQPSPPRPLARAAAGEPAGGRAVAPPLALAPGAKAAPRPGAPAPSARPIDPAAEVVRPAGGAIGGAASPRSASSIGPGRPAGGGAPVTARDEAAVVDLLSRQQWDQAKTALHQLAARDPSSKRIRALACYARGREAQLEGRLDDARVELGDALDLDPELSLAKTALTELFTRRK